MAPVKVTNRRREHHEIAGRQPAFENQFSRKRGGLVNRFPASRHGPGLGVGGSGLGLGLGETLSPNSRFFGREAGLGL